MVNVDVEFCGTCGHINNFNDMKEVVLERVPEAKVSGREGRQGSFEVEVNKIQIYSKLKTMAFPDFDEVADIVEDVANGGKVRQAIRQQPISCCIQ
ncbi:migration and invasion enhancer 1-like isoform X2 [Nilaparvata lugens]|uniref:migration and invasion enhancer 1 isoform X2 n=1 Tax=Nilaparvata lugens TaxID=108931 RepID=UPI000B99A1D5|nr:migration and invasion enhancer 1 isoform X2 [Nilaparvata lugens]XP_039290326.1 migration and invasion enhancer 1-like isoform X2 [Nilaparvata lugens]